VLQEGSKALPGYILPECFIPLFQEKPPSFCAFFTQVKLQQKTENRGIDYIWQFDSKELL